MTDTQNLAIRLNQNDNVVVARADLLPGTSVEGVDAVHHIPAGHKMAMVAIPQGEPVRKYDQIIGFASTDIAPGDHVHTQNIEFKMFERDYRIGEAVKNIDYVPEAERATFDGIVRENGRVATRNYIGVLTTVNCSATVARYIADHFRGPALEAYPNVDGVVAITHGSTTSTNCFRA